MVDVAKHLLNCLSAVNQLPGWSHVERYIRNPMAYMAGSSVIPVPAPKLGPGGSARPAADGAIDELMAKGTVLQKRLLMRLNWVLKLQNQEQKSPEPEVYLRVISAVQNKPISISFFLSLTYALICLHFFCLVSFLVGRTAVGRVTRMRL